MQPRSTLHILSMAFHTSLTGVLSRWRFDTNLVSTGCAASIKDTQMQFDAFTLGWRISKI